MSAQFRICVRCKVLTTQLEARLRLFNTGRCGHCGGELITYQVSPPRERLIEPCRFICPNPACHGRTNRVIDTRGRFGGEGVYRRRECLTCLTRWSTFEQSVGRAKIFSQTAKHNP